MFDLTLHKKWSLPLRVSSVNMTKSAGNCEFGHIYRRNSSWKTFCAVLVPTNKSKDIFKKYKKPQNEFRDFRDFRDL